MGATINFPLMDDGVFGMYFELGPSHVLLLLSRVPMTNTEGRDGFFLCQPNITVIVY